MSSWTLPCASSLVPSILHSPMASSALQHWTTSPTKEGCHWQAGRENRQNDSWPIQPDILSPSLLRLTSRKPLWLDLQPVNIKSRWRHKWKSAQVVNSHLVCDPTIRQPSFDLPRSSGLCWTVFAWNRDTAMPAKKMATYRHWSGSLWMAAYLSYTLQMKMLFCGWLVMVHDTHTYEKKKNTDCSEIQDGGP